MAQWGGGGGCGTAVSRCSVSAKITGHVALVPAAQHVRVLSSHGGALSMRHAQQGIGGSAVSGVGAGGQGLSKCLGSLAWCGQWGIRGSLLVHTSLGAAGCFMVW